MVQPKLDRSDVLCTNISMFIRVVHRHSPGSVFYLQSLVDVFLL